MGKKKFHYKYCDCGNSYHTYLKHQGKCHECVDQRQNTRYFSARSQYFLEKFNSIPKLKETEIKGFERYLENQELKRLCKDLPLNKKKTADIEKEKLHYIHIIENQASYKLSDKVVNNAKNNLEKYDEELRKRELGNKNNKTSKKSNKSINLMKFI